MSQPFPLLATIAMFHYYVMHTVCIHIFMNKNTLNLQDVSMNWAHIEYLPLKAEEDIFFVRALISSWE